ncbi:hypothetical protein V565_088470 [Rhizoctonia solani 123E]|uniref:Uncharacterized protein n=1 Tax=Rhizoctonia solani 123E TaxID=1423351 RepID=A0A074RZB9_9AGAM|nr:hypothetical protein V565_088470 [Rhizoctonia solani 123E]
MPRLVFNRNGLSFSHDHMSRRLAGDQRCGLGRDRCWTIDDPLCAVLRNGDMMPLWIWPESELALVCASSWLNKISRWPVFPLSPILVYAYPSFYYPSNSHVLALFDFFECVVCILLYQSISRFGSFH